MINPYKQFLDTFFESLLHYRHFSSHVNKVFNVEIKKYTHPDSILQFVSALVISDWTAATDNGWEINFSTGIISETTKDKYGAEMKKFYSKQLCLLYAQSYEAFERYIKDCLFNRINRDSVIRDFTISILPKYRRSSFSRKNLPGGINLFKILRKACGDSFKKFSSENNMNLMYWPLLTILSEVRHSITHNDSQIEKKLILISKHHEEIFSYLFNYREISSEIIIIELDYRKYELLVKRFSEFAFQILKMLSIEEELEWNFEALHKVSQIDS